MMRRVPLLARGLVLVFAMALAMAGFGHRFASAAELQRTQIAQLFGADFCITDDEGAPRADASCPVCHLVAGLYLAAAIEGAAAPAELTFRVQPPVAARHLLASTEAAPPPSRGPPSA